MIRRGWWLGMLMFVVSGTALRAAEPPRLWAVIIGIDSYQDKKIPDAPGARTDAREIRNWLVRTAGWNSQQVLVMDPNSQAIFRGVGKNMDDLLPTRANLEKVFREWLPPQLKPGDVVLVYFAGQAVGGLNVPNSRDVLLPFDAKADRLDETGWKIADALDTIGSKGENPILVWLDTSLSGRGKSVVVDAKERRTNPERLLAETTRWPGTAAWISASGMPSAVPADRESGPFVKAIIPALGTPKAPVNFLGSLFTVGRDLTLRAQGFRAAGSLGPGLALWPKLLADSVPPESEFLLQRGHGDRLTGALFSADGSTMITSSEDSSIKVWRTSDRTLVRTLPGHSIGVTSMAVSADGSLLATGDGAGQVILWSLSDFRAHVLPGRSPHLGGVSRVAFLEDRSTFASFDLAERVVLWKMDGNSLKAKVLIDKATAFSAQGQTIATGLLPSSNEAIIRLFDSDGTAIRDLKGLRSRILPDALAIQGDRVAAGDKSGHVMAWKSSGGEPFTQFDAAEAVNLVVFGDDRILAASGESIWSLGMAPGDRPKSIKTTSSVARIAVSSDGQSAAAALDDGSIVGWRFPDTMVKLEMDAEGPSSTVVAFPPQGDRLVSGDQDGGVRFWDWPKGSMRARIRPGRGRIESLSVTTDGRSLLQVDHDYLAKVWDLSEARSLRTVAGEWISGTFAPDGKSIVLTSKTGEIVVIDPKTTIRKKTTFEKPLDEEKRPILSAFGVVAISPDGKKVVSGSREAPVAAVWPIDGGKPVATVLDHAERISAVSFASDSDHWLTASWDGTAKVWSGEAKAPLWTLKLEKGDREKADTAVTAAKIAPGPLSRVVTCHRDGRVVIWKLGVKGQASARVIGQFEGPVSSVEWLDGGKKLMAGGWDKNVRLWTDQGGDFATADLKRLAPQHTERVNAVIGPVAGQYLASAGDDGAIRFWKTDGSSLLGTISTAFDDGTWVAFDELGHFDSAPGGETHVTYLQSGKILTLDQYDSGGRIFGLGELWLSGRGSDVPPPLRARKPIGLAIDPPIPTPNPDEMDLRVRLGESDSKELRLYQNDMPVRTIEDFQEDPDDPTVRIVRVRLGAGENRFVAMAARPEPGAIHGRSNTMIVKGPEVDVPPAGRVHVLALGVSKYDTNALRFAHKDASDLSRFLEQNGLETGRKPGIIRVLQDDEVKPPLVTAALRKIRDDCQPEDTIVVFLAGHTDIRRGDRFCLLLDKFPFAPGALEVGMRGPILANPKVDAQVLEKTILPYADIYQTLSRMNARNRLVVIDACQAGAIFDDPAIQRIQRKADDAAHEARTSYLLAARKGEPAAEAAKLEHGLMTYLLLTGMGAPKLEKPPGGEFGSADTDGDKTITTEELRQYIEINLPILASRVAVGVPRANPNPGAPQAVPVEPLKARGGTSSFPVAKLPKK